MAPDERPESVFGARAAHYTASAAHTETTVLEWLRDELQPEPADDVLDIATGTGHTAFAVAPHVRRVVGADVTPAMLHEARRLRETNGRHNVTFAVADAHTLPFGDKTFQAVISRLAPHHFTDLDRALREMGRVLPAGGRLVVNDRSVPEDDFVDETMNALDRLHDPSHVRQYRPSEWRVRLEATGFHVSTNTLYTRQRPLTSLTKNASSGDRERIHTLLNQCTSDQAHQLGYESRDGELYITHWYVMIAARKE